MNPKHFYGEDGRIRENWLSHIEVNSSDIYDRILDGMLDFILMLMILSMVTFGILVLGL